MLQKTRSNLLRKHNFLTGEFMKKKYLALAISILVSTHANSEVESPRMATVYGYEIGGSTLPSQFTKYSNTSSIGLGVSWDMNIGCGTFDPKISVSNQLNGITDGFKSMMGNIITEENLYFVTYCCVC